MKLKFSSVQQPELIGYLALLNSIQSSIKIEIEEVVGYCEAVKRREEDSDGINCNISVFSP